MIETTTLNQKGISRNRICIKGKLEIKMQKSRVTASQKRNTGGGLYKKRRGFGGIIMAGVGV